MHRIELLANRIARAPAPIRQRIVAESICSDASNLQFRLQRPATVLMLHPDAGAVRAYCDVIAHWTEHSARQMILALIESAVDASGLYLFGLRLQRALIARFPEDSALAPRPRLRAGLVRAWSTELLSDTRLVAAADPDVVGFALEHEPNPTDAALAYLRTWVSSEQDMVRAAALFESYAVRSTTSFAAGAAHTFTRTSPGCEKPGEAAQSSRLGSSVGRARIRRR